VAGRPDHDVSVGAHDLPLAQPGAARHAPSRALLDVSSGLFACKDQRTTVRQVKRGVYEVTWAHGVRDGYSQCIVNYAELGFR